VTSDTAGKLQAVFDSWNAGHTTRLEIDVAVEDLITEHNVDEVVQALPDWYRVEFEELLRTLAASEPEDFISIFGGTRLENAHEAAVREIRERRHVERLVLTARAWMKIG